MPLNERRKSLIRLLAVCLAGALASGCGVSVKLSETELPEAAVEPYPLTVGLRYGNDIEAFQHVETLPNGNKYTIDLGDASARMFIDTFEDMFERTVIVPPGEDPPPGIDLLVQPSLVALEFALPAQTVTEDYAVWIRYKIQVYDGSGSQQALYSLSAYGESLKESALGGTKSAIESAAVQALRDAGVLLLTRFEKDSGLADRQLSGLAAVSAPTMPSAIPTSAPPTTESEDAADPAASNPPAEKFL